MKFIPHSPPDYWGFTWILRFHPTTELSPEFWGFTRLLRFHPNTGFSPEFWVFIRILVFHPITEVSPEYWAFTWILGFHPILPTVGNIFHLPYFRAANQKARCACAQPDWMCKYSGKINLHSIFHHLLHLRVLQHKNRLLKQMPLMTEPCLEADPHRGWRRKKVKL